MSLEYFLEFLFFWSKLPPSTPCCRHVVIILVGVRICHIHIIVVVIIVVIIVVVVILVGVDIICSIYY